MNSSDIIQLSYQRFVQKTKKLQNSLLNFSNIEWTG